VIIPALVRLYDRLIEEGDETVAAKGYSRQKISFKVVLNEDGTLHAFEPVSVAIPRPTKPGKGGVSPEIKFDHRPELRLVPGQSKPSGSGLNPCLLWDNAAYMLGFKAEDPKPERTKDAFEAFRKKHLELRDEIKDDGFRRVCKFLESWQPADVHKYPEIAGFAPGFGVFQLRGDAEYTHDRKTIRSWWEAQCTDDAPDASDDSPRVPSLADGAVQPIARLHEPKIKGVFGAQSSGAALVSFNQSAFTSYDKEQGNNAPVGVQDAFKYCTALNRLTTDKDRRVSIAGDTLVFWSDGAPKVVEDWFAAEIADSKPDEQARHLFLRMREGKAVDELGDPSIPFYVLGLSPNIARLSVRLFLASTVGDIVGKLRSHHAGLAMLPEPPGAPPITIRAIVNETAMAKGGFPDSDRVIPTLAGEVARAILTGNTYPAALLAGIVARVRVEGLADDTTRNDWRNAQHRRCAIIRACLVRNFKKEVPVSLDLECTTPAYLFGRLFAVLERIQENALGDINRTIKDSYFGAAATTPASVFPRLLKLAQHHLNKIDGDKRGQRITRERELGEIVNRLPAERFPRLFSLPDQGLFAIGYYHQRATFFTKRETTES